MKITNRLTACAGKDKAELSSLPAQTKLMPLRYKNRNISFQISKKSVCKALILLTLCLAPIACSKGDKNQQEEPSKEIESVTTENDQNLECRHVIDAYCTSCHQESRICQKLGKKSLSQWKRTIKRMIKHGAKLNSEQKDSLAECLANQSDSITGACE